MSAREKLEALVENSTTGEAIMAAADAYKDEAVLAILDEILDGEYTLEQVADMRLNAEES